MLADNTASNGVNVPTFLYGTAWKEQDTERCVRDALNTGFRGIDTANQRKHYFEAGVGAALKAAYDRGTLSREELFIQTKFTFIGGQDHRLPYDPKANLETQVMQSFQSSLEHLHTDYLDSYVLHGPSSQYDLTEEDWEVWGAMEKLQKSNRVRLLGISNVKLEQLKSLCDGCKVKPSFVQNRCYAVMGWDQELRAFCRKNEIHYQGFSLLTANAQVFRLPKFKELVNKYNCTPEQLIFRLALELQIIPLTGTTKLNHMKEDLGASQIKFTTDDAKLIESIVQ